MKSTSGIHCREMDARHGNIALPFTGYYLNFLVHPIARAPSPSLPY